MDPKCGRFQHPHLQLVYKSLIILPQQEILRRLSMFESTSTLTEMEVVKSPTLGIHQLPPSSLHHHHYHCCITIIILLPLSQTFTCIPQSLFCILISSYMTTYVAIVLKKVSVTLLCEETKMLTKNILIECLPTTLVYYNTCNAQSAKKSEVIEYVSFCSFQKSLTADTSDK